MRNDASPAIAAFLKGSLQSPEMQRCAVYLSRVAAANEVDFIPWHVPSLRLVAEGTQGIDGTGTVPGQDANLSHILGPAVGPGLWDSVARVVSAMGPGLADHGGRRGYRAKRAGATFLELLS